jgi:hypothetical protein
MITLDKHANSSTNAHTIAPTMASVRRVDVSVTLVSLEKTVLLLTSHDARQFRRFKSKVHSARGSNTPSDGLSESDTPIVNACVVCLLVCLFVVAT